MRYLLLMVLVVLAGCRSGSGTQTREIVFWHSFVATTGPALQDLVADFERAHPGVRVRAQYVPTGDALVQKLLAASAAGDPPDVAWIHTDFLDALVQARALLPIADVAGPDSLTAAERADFFPALLTGATWRDTLYALPMEATSLALFYRRDLLRRAGISAPPADWRQLEEAARRLTADQDGDGSKEHIGLYVPVFPASGSLNLWMVLQFTPFLWQAGGDEVDAAGAHARFAEPPGVAALALWKRLYDTQDMRRFTTAHDMAFASGLAAMVFDGPWNLPRYRRLPNTDWGVAPLPAGPAGRATYLDAEHLAVFRGTREPAAAWAFLRYIVRPDVQARFSMASGYLPVRRSVLDRPEYRAALAKDPALGAFVQSMAWARGRRPLPGRVAFNGALAGALEAATVGRQEPAAALRTAAAKADAILAGRRP